ncbi:MAG: AMP-binding protein [Alphaproteobacteria bacterium]|nr:AMP-binding protein [Alphaproteobacteria bacterium]
MTECDYLKKRAQFVWDRPQKYNFVRDCLAQWAVSQPDATALYWTDAEGAQYRRSFAQLHEDAARAAAVLTELGVKRGQTVLIILSREQSWWELVLGCIQIGAMLSPGTIQLTPKDIAYRMDAAEARAIITNAELSSKVDEAAEQCGWTGVKLCIDDVDTDDWNSYPQLRSEKTPLRDCADTLCDEPSLCYFTSGTTGNPKLTIHRQDYPLGHKATGSFWLDAKPGALIWNLSDTGWAKAAWSSLFAPWLCGAGVFAFHGGAFDAEDTLATLENYPITALCAPPTVYRILVQQQLSDKRFHSLRRCVSAGEPLNPEVIKIWRDQTGLQIYEGYGQTETVLLCGNFDGMDVKSGSMGLPAPGVDLQVIDDNGAILAANVEGDIAVNIAPANKPAGMFLGYKDDHERTKSVYRGDWYLTGDRACRDEEGYFWFVGRSDDVILSSGYRIGPFEVESVLFEHPAVAESAVVASPDETRGEVVKAFVVLAAGHQASETLAKELQDFVKTHTAPYKYPRKVEFVSELPKTISGKIRRKELKEREWRDAGEKTS